MAVSSNGGGEGPKAPTATPRADQQTPLGLVLPTVGLDRDTWGDITNANWTLVDSLIQALQTSDYNVAVLIQQIVDGVHAYIEPIGSMKLWPVDAAPAGWLTCDGYAVSRTDFGELFAVIGTSWGAGDGNTTFNIPDLRGCTLVHRGDWMPFGGRLGETGHVLSLNEMPVHSHGGTTDGVGDHTHGYAAVRIGGSPNVAPAPGYALQETGGQTGGAGSHAHNFATSQSGGSWGHNNIQPSVGICTVIKCLHVGV
jgi:microcystin-dependent protein